MKPPPATELLTRIEVANLFGVSLPTVREYTLSGKLKGYRIGRRVRYKRAEVEQSLQEISIR
jgi:excisionase family DNA binding protein